MAQGSAIRSNSGTAGRRTRLQLAHDPIERGVRIHLVEVEAAVLAGVAEHGGKIEAKPVDADGVAPVRQRIDDQVLGDRVIGVVIAAHPRIVPGILQIGCQRVIRRIVKPAERIQVVGGLVVTAPRAALAGMIVDRVDEDLDPRIVECLDHRLHLARRAAGRTIVRVAAIRREVVQRFIAPVVDPVRGTRLDVVGVVLGFLKWQKLHRGDAEAGEISRLSARRPDRCRDRRPERPDRFPSGRAHALRR